jgi:hypothetical protein
MDTLLWEQMPFGTNVEAPYHSLLLLLKLLLLLLLLLQNLDAYSQYFIFCIT